ncbi:MAG: tRNA pseudouridine(38-40) synthase TruA [Cytophagaceae bacterium]|nr:tRNA pseudouridine(38-40) synthase TruA [Cytophagaceae bacterium]MDW8455821.1 tRNA pseudouridine(38-40) synthase TruA [Cytophagaceae bacterium]
MRIFIDISYKGTSYHGWQIQQNAHTVQKELNAALSAILRTNVETVGSGRTDTGVHAIHQVAHLDVPEYPKNDFLYRINSLLPHDISINSWRKVHPDAHARYSATSRTYEYRISKVKDPFLHDLVFFFDRPLNLQHMQEACSILCRYNDFECFSRSNSQVKHFNCIIHQAKWEEENNKIIFTIQANRFLRGMVRAIAGTMLDIGMNKISLSDFENILLSKDRRKAGAALPPQGLFLTDVKYPDDIYISD